MAGFLQQIVEGLGAGAIYASLALALVLIYQFTGIVNFAQGELAMFSDLRRLAVHGGGHAVLAGTGRSRWRCPSRAGC